MFDLVNVTKIGLTNAGKISGATGCTPKVKINIRKDFHVGHSISLFVRPHLGICDGECTKNHKMNHGASRLERLGFNLACRAVSHTTHPGGEFSDGRVTSGLFVASKVNIRVFLGGAGLRGLNSLNPRTSISVNG